MEETRLVGLYYHQVPLATQDKMKSFRKDFITLANKIAFEIADDRSPSARSRNMALTHLEEALMHVIQALAMGPGSVIVDPWDDKQQGQQL